MGNTNSVFTLRNEAAVVPLEFTPELLIRLQGKELIKTQLESQVEDHEQTPQLQLESLQQQKRQQWEATSVKQASRHISTLISLHPPFPPLAPNLKIQDLEKRVLECYGRSDGKSLDCWREVSEFRDAEREMAEDFITRLEV